MKWVFPGEEEIGEAPPAAEAARRFQGSGTIGSPEGRESSAAREGGGVKRTLRRRERRRAQKDAMLKITAAALVLLALLLLLGLASGPDRTPGELGGEGAATFAAGQAYDEVMERCGDETLARMEAERAYREVRNAWD